MSSFVDIPAPPLSLTSDIQDFLGTHVEVKLLNGDKLRATLLDVNGPQQFISIKVSGNDKELEIPFSDLRVMHFSEISLSPNEEYPLSPDDSNIILTSSKQDYEINFTDGAHQKDKTCGWVVDDYALHLFPRIDENNCSRIFVPLCTVSSYSIGPFIHELQHKKQKSDNGKNIVSNANDLIEVLENNHQYNAAFGKILVDEKLISNEQLEKALAIQKQDKSKKLGDILKEQSLISSSELHQALAMQLGLPFIHLRDFEIDQNILGILSQDFARGYKVMPLLRHDGHLVIAISNPANTEVINLLRFTTGDNIEVVVATEEDIQWAIDHYYGDYDTSQAMEEMDRLKQNDKYPQQLQQRELEKLASEKPTVRLVNYIINDAINRHASDIHIRANKKHIQLYFRIDGTLIPIRRLDKLFLPAIISRIKILGYMDITERRLPQDGRTQFSSHGKKVDLRISTMPTINGESAVLRILDLDYSLRDTSEIGLNKQDQQSLEGLLHLSHGMLLVTGPTGSGKSTTLYAALQNISQQNVNIITVEDPVEYHIDGIEQVQVNPVTGYTFAKALRHILRHDPDVIMIGEIRDKETAKISVESALTGHLVLSTLHTNSAAGTITRLLEMGIEPYLLNSTLLAVLAQRLVRKNCPHCITEEPVNDSIRNSLGVSTDEVFYHSKGCKECNHTGYVNRAAVYELLIVSQNISKLINENVSVDELNQQAINNGMTPLTQNALEMARAGTISLKEVYRVRLE